MSPGFAIGRAVAVADGDESVFRFPIAAEMVDDELRRLHAAVARTRQDLAKTKVRAADLLGEELAGIFQAHDLMLVDRLFLGEVERRIRDERVNAEWAIEEVAAALSERFAGIGNENVREHGDDLRDVTRHLLHSLRGIEHHQFSEIQGAAVVVAEELTPTETIRLARQGVGGLVLEAGGQNSHTAIIAGALNLPLVLGVGPLRGRLDGESVVVVDADQHRVIVNPGVREQAVARLRVRRTSPEQRAVVPVQRPARVRVATRDNKRVRLLANVELLDELPSLLQVPCDGIGLYRSEFLYIEKSPALPTEEEHLAAFRTLLEAGGDNMVVIRTFDLGGRTLSRRMLDRDEENPSLGLRGIRLTLKRSELFRPQLRALLRSSVYGNLHIMAPMVSNFEEVREFLRLLTTLTRELRSEGHAVKKKIPIGVMIETPAAAMIADRLARELDFFAIGTNDLAQYTLAVDRNNEEVADLYQPLHPGLLRLLQIAVRNARRGGCRVIEVCGEMAGHPEWVPLLLGAGIDRLSMSPRGIAEVGEAVRAIDSRACGELFRRAVQCSTQREVAELVEAFHR